MVTQARFPILSLLQGAARPLAAARLRVGFLRSGCCALLLALAMPCAGQAPSRSLSLDQALALAEKSSPRLRIAEAQLWIAQRLPLAKIREKAAQNWGITNIKTISRYLALARQRMVEELITDRRRHQAEQIFALNDCARRAMDAEQFNAAVGAFRVIAEIGGLLRAPIKPPEPRA